MIPLPDYFSIALQRCITFLNIRDRRFGRGSFADRPAGGFAGILDFGIYPVGSIRTGHHF
jgi:hypothetical protein